MSLGFHCKDWTRLEFNLLLGEWLVSQSSDDNSQPLTGVDCGAVSQWPSGNQMHHIASSGVETMVVAPWQMQGLLMDFVLQIAWLIVLFCSVRL